MEQNQSSTSGNGFTAHVPPPPSEVTVRTMESDIASMAASGGASPKPKPVKFSHKTDQDENTGPSGVSGAPQSTQATPGFFSGRAFLILSLSALLIVVFLAGYYVLYPLLNPPEQAVTKSPADTSGNANGIVEHKSFFGQPTDGIFTLDIPLQIEGLQADRDQVNSFISGLSGTFFEIKTENSLGKPISAGDFFNLIGANIMDKSSFDTSFEKDFTIFLYKDKNNLWPGYVLQIKSGESRIFLQTLVQSKVESASTSLSNLFLNQVGTAGAQFQDEILSGQPIRAMDFFGPTSTLAYGWFFNKYLIISTSLDGMKQAVLHF